MADENSFKGENFFRFKLKNCINLEMGFSWIFMISFLFPEKFSACSWKNYTVAHLRGDPFDLREEQIRLVRDFSGFHH
jgi:hypothetical protein